MFFLLLACAANTGDADALQADRDALAEALWPQVEGYETWDQAEPWVGIQPSADGTHGEFVQIWLDSVALASYEADAADAGAIVAKKGYSDAEGLDPYGNLTVMWKPEDATAVPETGWLWVSFGSDGSFTEAEDGGGCAGCHASGSDYRRMVTDTP